jgi:hypothetical protein
MATVKDQWGLSLVYLPHQVMNSVCRNSEKMAEDLMERRFLLSGDFHSFASWPE